MPQVGAKGNRRSDPNWRVNQDEADATRQALEPKEGWLFSNFPYYAALTDTPQGTANRLRLGVVLPQSYKLLLNEARINVTTAAAGAVFLVGIYRLVGDEFRLVPFSSVTFSAATTGLKTVRLSQKAALEANTPYWVGIIGSDATAGLSGSAVTIRAGTNTRQFDAGAAILPSSLEVAATTRITSVGNALAVWYLSREAALVV